MRNRSILKIFFIIILSFTTVFLQGQSDIVKGRLFVLPGDMNLFSIGVGYERVTSKNHSFQILLNRYGYDLRGTDGDSKKITTLVPEYRIYLLTDELRNLDNSLFIGFFNEFSFSKLTPSGFDVEDESDFLLEENDIMINPGVLVGKKYILSTSLSLEVYFGIKYRIINRKSEYLEDDIRIVRETNFSDKGFRGGINISYKWPAANSGE